MHREGRLNDALACFAKASSLDPVLAAAWNGQAAVLFDSGNARDAVHILTEAVAATRGEISVLANLAILLEKMGRYAESVEIADQVLAIQPEHLSVRLTLSVALLALQRPGEAITHCQQLVASQPQNANVFLNLGEALMAADEYMEALAAYGHAIHLDNTLSAAHIGRGQAFAMLGRFEEADAVFAESARNDPQKSFACFQRIAARTGLRIPSGWQARAIEIYLSRGWLQQQACNWRGREAYLNELCQYAEYLANTKETAHDESVAFQSLAAPLTPRQRRGLLDAVATGITTANISPARRRQTRIPGKLRLGFLSTGFRNHPSAQLHWRHLALYDRSRFRVHAYSLVDDPSSHLRERVAKSADSFCDLSHATAEEASWRIARDGIDILVDLAGYQDNARPEILAARPAPLQVSYHGSPLSMSAHLVDYRITDRIVSPNASEFTEAAVWIPFPHCMYNDAEPIADRAPTRRECGLPDTGLVFCAFNAAFKIEPEIFGIWMELLHKTAGSILWLLDGGTTMQDNLRREAVARGVANERLVFAPRLERTSHLARHACADLFLDTFICNAHTTAADALWAGLPVLTRAGDTMASRFAATQVTAAGLQELIVSTTEDYLALAVRLAGSPMLLTKLRQRLADSREGSRLFATERRVGDLARAFELMWARHCRGEPPASFDVSDDNSRS